MKNSPPIPRPVDLSVIIPVLNEAGEIGATLDRLRESIAGSPLACETIAVDGGSTDGTRDWLGARDDLIVIDSPHGRARQMNAGARVARGGWFLFLHADGHLDPGVVGAIGSLIEGAAGANADPEVRNPAAAPPVLYSFELGLRNPAPAYRRMEMGVAWRCRVMGLPYGDQGFLMSRATHDAMGGFDGAAAMEDLDFALRLRARGKIVMLPWRISASARQWERDGVVPAILQNVGRLAAGLTLHYLHNGAGSGST